MNHRPACQPACQAPDRQEKPARSTRLVASSVDLGRGWGGGNSLGLGMCAAHTHSAPYSLLQLRQWPGLPRPLHGGKAVRGGGGEHIPNLSQSGLAGPRPYTTIYSIIFCNFTVFFFT